MLTASYPSFRSNATQTPISAGQERHNGVLRARRIPSTSKSSMETITFRGLGGRNTRNRCL